MSGTDEVREPSGQAGYLAQIDESARRYEQLELHDQELERELKNLEAIHDHLQLIESRKRYEKLHLERQELEDEIRKLEARCGPLESTEDVNTDSALSDSWENTKQQIDILSNQSKLTAEQLKLHDETIRLILKHLEFLTNSYCKEADELRERNNLDDSAKTLDSVADDLKALIATAQAFALPQQPAADLLVEQGHAEAHTVEQEQNADEQ